MKILLVEDDHMLQGLYFELLQSSGYTVEGVTDGVAAYNRMKTGAYDLVLLDQLMPGMSGIEVMQKLRADAEAKPNKKVIFMTNVDDSRQLADMAAISDGYFQKGSLTPDQFLKKVSDLLQS